MVAPLPAPRRLRARATLAPALLLLALVPASPAFAQSGVQVSPDGKLTLVSKDVGGERWAITRENDIGVVTGNVFFPGGGEPAFLWCAQLGSDASGFHLSCSGADRCPLAPCPSEEWVFLAEVTLPESFFQPRADGASEYVGPLSLARIAGAAAGASTGSTSGVQETPALARTLISKDVGAERWAITYDREGGTLTGNVFFPDGGDPRFVFCEPRERQGASLAFACSGAERCTSGACGASDWTFIADVPLPETFVSPPTAVDLEALSQAARTALGENAAFAAIVLAIDRGYSLRQVLRAALTGRLRPGGEIRLKVGLVEEPAGPPLGQLEPAASSADSGLERIAATAAELSAVFGDRLGPGADALATLTRLLDRGYTIAQIKQILDGASVVDCTAIASVEEFRACASRHGDILVLTDRTGATITPGRDPEEAIARRPQTPCGNGRVESGELCDGGDLDRQTCETLGHLGGTLRCTERCVFDELGCRSTAKCGDGAIDRFERCDGARLGGETCASLGYLGGDLRCTPQCDFDASECRTSAVCGDGVAEQREPCDRTHLRGESCQRLGFLAGSLRCTNDCQLDNRDCRNDAVCGNGAGEGNEQCDGADFRGDSCESLGFVGGSLACTPACRIDTAGCRTAARCGDGVAEQAEACDGADLRGESCERLGFVGGTLRCTPSCRLDQDDCRERPLCGDGVADPGEACDRFDFRGQTCRDLDFPSGNLVCTADCRIDSRSCQREQRCGDGLAEGTEQCDGQDLNGQSCTGLGFEDGGTLRCGGDCRYDTSGCHDVTCGNNRIEGTEECDGSDLGGRSCENLGLGSGSVRCTAGCRLNTRNCCDGVSCGGECYIHGTVCCGGGNACPAGNACIPSGGCCPPEGKICPGGGCFLDSAVCCANGTACPGDTVCVTGGCCPAGAPHLCPDGRTCATGPGACP